MEERAGKPGSGSETKLFWIYATFWNGQQKLVLWIVTLLPRTRPYLQAARSVQNLAKRVLGPFIKLTTILHIDWLPNFGFRLECLKKDNYLLQYLPREILRLRVSTEIPHPACYYGDTCVVLTLNACHEFDPADTVPCPPKSTPDPYPSYSPINAGWSKTSLTIFCWHNCTMLPKVCLNIASR